MDNDVIQEPLNEGSSQEPLTITSQQLNLLNSQQLIDIRNDSRYSLTKANIKQINRLRKAYQTGKRTEPSGVDDETLVNDQNELNSYSDNKGKMYSTSHISSQADRLGKAFEDQAYKDANFFGQYDRRFERQNRYNLFNESETQNNKDTKCLILTDKDFDLQGNCWMETPFKASYIRCSEISFHNTLPTINIKDDNEIRFAETFVSGSHSVPEGGVLSCTLTPGFYNTDTLKDQIQTKMFQASYAQNNSTPYTYVVNFNQVTGLCTISATTGGSPADFNIRYTHFAYSVLGFTQDQTYDGNVKAYSWIASSFYNLNYGSVLSVGMNIIPSFSHSFGKKRDPILCVVPMSNPAWFLISSKPALPFISLNHEQVINHIKLTFKCGYVDTNVTEYILSPASAFYMILEFY